MALTFNVGLDNINEAESTTSWTGFNRAAGGNPTPADETDIFIQNTQAVSAKISGNNQYKGIWYDATTGIDMTVPGRHLYIWVAITTVGYLLTLANGGLFITVSSDDATLDTNWNEYYVGGSDFTLDAGFVRYVIDLTKTPSNSSGTCVLTSVRSFGAGINGTGATIKSENLIVDRIDYGDGQLQLIGDGSTTATWEDFFTEDDAIGNRYGIITKKEGVYYVKGRLSIGDAPQIDTTTFDDDTGAVLVFENPQYYETILQSSIALTNTFYGIDAFASGLTNTTITFGNVVGSGDDRQGIQGGFIQSAGPKWFLDFASNIGSLGGVSIYGLSVRGATEGVDFDDGNKTSVISSTFLNCGQVTPGLSNSGAEFLSSFVIDPLDVDGVTDGTNLGLEFPYKIHQIKKHNFITSNPVGATQHMSHLSSEETTYEITFDAIKFFGDYSSDTIWHGLNSGTNVGLTISAINAANPNEDEFENTNGGSVAVSTDVTLSIEVVDADDAAIENAQCAIFQTSNDLQLMNEDTLASGFATQSFNYVSETDIYFRVRKSSTGDTKYINLSGTGQITTNGFSTKVTLRQDTNA